MSFSYAFHFFSFKAQNYARNLFVQDLLLQRSVEFTERVIIKTIQDVAQGTSQFRIENQKVFFEKKVFIYDFEQFYLSFHKLLESAKAEGQGIENLVESWKEWIHMLKQDFVLDKEASHDEITYLQAKNLLDNRAYDQLCIFLSSQKKSSLKDYFLRNCAVYFLKQDEQEKAKGLLQEISSSLERSFLLGELVRKALFNKNTVEAQALLPLIPNLHLKFCMQHIAVSNCT
jgi:hypothetical protein